LIVRSLILFILVLFLTLFAGLTSPQAFEMPGDSLDIFKEEPQPAEQLEIDEPPIERPLESLLEPPIECPLEKSPPGAAIRSAVLPGWGQFYTENRFKGILFAGAQVGLFSLWWIEKKAGERDMDKFNATDDMTFYNSGTSHQDKASNYFSWGLLVSLVSVLDAYIDAHLYRFDEKVRMDDEGRVEVSVRLY